MGISFKKIKVWSSHNTAFDHIFDHLQTRATWKQCSQEHPKAPFLDTKAPKITRNYTKNLCICVRDTAFTRPNIFSLKSSKKPWNNRVSGLFNFFQKTPNLHIDHMFWPLMKRWVFKSNSGISLHLKNKFLYFVYCMSKFEGWLPIITPPFLVNSLFYKISRIFQRYLSMFP